MSYLPVQKKLISLRNGGMLTFVPTFVILEPSFAAKWHPWNQLLLSQLLSNLADPLALSVSLLASNTHSFIYFEGLTSVQIPSLSSSSLLMELVVRSFLSFSHIFPQVVKQSFTVKLLIPCTKSMYILCNFSMKMITTHCAKFTSITAYALKSTTIKLYLCSKQPLVSGVHGNCCICKWYQCPHAPYQHLSGNFVFFQPYLAGKGLCGSRSKYYCPGCSSHVASNNCQGWKVYWQ